jgi:4-hydroxy-2-oxoheptanedioate aldolase
MPGVRVAAIFITKHSAECIVSLPINTFKKNILAGTRTWGCWLQLASSVAAEAMARAGNEFLVIDMEHAPNEVPTVLPQLQAIASAGKQALVRLPWNDAVVVKRILDTGAQTLMFPMIQTVEEAERAVAATRYPPKGIRGVAGVMRASGFGTFANYAKLASDEICVTLQLETATAVDRIAEIAKVDGVDGLFIGPADLAASMGHVGDTGHPDVKARLQAAAAACKAAGRASGILAQNEETATLYAGYGYTFIAVGSDLGLMMQRARTISEFVHK